MDSARRILTLLGVGTLVAAAANGLSPVGVSWSHPLGKGLAAEVSAAGLDVVETGSVAALLAGGAVLFVDARPRPEFRTGRLPGAVSLPWEELERSPGAARSLPRNRPLVVYCANEFCDSSLRVAERLRSEGHAHVAVWVEGYDAWWDRGGNVDQD